MNGVFTVKIPDEFRVQNNESFSDADKATVAFVNGDIDMDDLMSRLGKIAEDELSDGTK